MNTELNKKLQELQSVLQLPGTVLHNGIDEEFVEAAKDFRRADEILLECIRLSGEQPIALGRMPDRGPEWCADVKRRWVEHQNEVMQRSKPNEVVQQRSIDDIDDLLEFIRQNPDKAKQPIVAHMNMDPNASPETIEAVKDMVNAAYSYKPGEQASSSDIRYLHWCADALGRILAKLEAGKRRSRRSAPGHVCDATIAVDSALQCSRDMAHEYGVGKYVSAHPTEEKPKLAEDENMWHPDQWLIGNVEAWEKLPPTEARPNDDASTQLARAELRKVMDECGWDIYGGSNYPWVRAMNYAWEEGFLAAYIQCARSIAQPSQTILSRDYERLYEHLRNQGDYVFVRNGHIFEGHVGILRHTLHGEFEVRGYGIEHERCSTNATPLKIMCQRLKLEWVAPSPKVVESLDEGMSEKILMAVMGVKMQDGSIGIGKWSGHEIEQLRKHLKWVHVAHPYPYNPKDNDNVHL